MGHSESPLFDAIIIGAGICGLTLASRLRAQNKKFIILEKSAGVGGRIATRRVEDCTFDHGAQFIKMLRAQKASWQESLKIREIGKIWFSSSEDDYLVFPKGMTQFPKSLSNPLELRLNEKVILVDVDSVCTVKTETGATYSAEKLFITCPLPQALSLLTESRIAYPPDLNQIQYASALVGLFRLQSSDKTIFDIRHLQDVSDAIYSINNQLSKEVSQNLAFTVVMQPTWSQRNFDQEDAVSLQNVSTCFEHFLNQVSSERSFSILSSQLKKWRYSHPLSSAASPFQEIGDRRKIFLLGDAFGGGSISGAIRSAHSFPIEN